MLLERSMALNEMGAFIWAQCDGQHTFEQIVTEICQHYEVKAKRQYSRTCMIFSLIYMLTI